MTGRPSGVGFGAVSRPLELLNFHAIRVKQESEEQEVGTGWSLPIMRTQGVTPV
jgi:hypothetical protein